MAVMKHLPVDHHRNSAHCTAILKPAAKKNLPRRHLREIPILSFNTISRMCGCKNSNVRLRGVMNILTSKSTRVNMFTQSTARHTAMNISAKRISHNSVEGIIEVEDEE